MLEHGGGRQRAAREFGIAPADWLDLSTGVSPFAWPVPDIPSEVWHRLPEDDDGLVEVARRYYGSSSLLPVAGSQAAIQALPMLRKRSRVGVLSPGYGEHALAWRRAGHAVESCSASELQARCERYDVIVLANPNNPSGECFERERLLEMRDALAPRQGWLVVDEAFIDATPEHSLCTLPAHPSLIVLRSIGKFFGLAGARAGFVHASTDVLLALREWLGPWTLTGPARHVLKHALADEAWQVEARARLACAGQHLAALLANRGLVPSAGTAYFQWVRHANAKTLHRALAREGVLVRLFEEPASLRFGLPGTQAQFDRLDQALCRTIVAPAIKGGRQ